jgi:hypothetical protein
VGLDMLLEILGALERFAAEVTFVWLQRNVHSNVRGDVITFDGGGTAVTPLAGQIQVVGALAADMALADVILMDMVSVSNTGFEQKRGAKEVKKSSSTSHNAKEQRKLRRERPVCCSGSINKE